MIQRAALCKNLRVIAAAAMLGRELKTTKRLHEMPSILKSHLENTQLNPVFFLSQKDQYLSNKDKIINRTGWNIIIER